MLPNTVVQGSQRRYNTSQRKKKTTDGLHVLTQHDTTTLRYYTVYCNERKNLVKQVKLNNVTFTPEWQRSYHQTCNNCFLPLGVSVVNTALAYYHIIKPPSKQNYICLLVPEVDLIV